MDNKNENWKKGDIAVCINNGTININRSGPNPPLKINSEYIVGGVNQCPCGRIQLDVGIGSYKDQTIYCKCGTGITGDGIWWCSSIRFVKKDIRSKEEKMEEAILNEDYELAQRLLSEQ